MELVALAANYLLGSPDTTVYANKIYEQTVFIEFLGAVQ